MFDEFVLEDTTACAEHVDRTIYHLDGPSALQHVPRLLRIEALHCIQWIQGAGKPYPASWTDLLNRIQAAGKTVQVWYATPFTGTAAFLRELDVLCSELDPLRLFVAAEVPTVEQAELAMRRVEEACRQARARPR
jgi:5-methyltetrahydrofolate--homocysteine methyltransferase